MTEPTSGPKETYLGDGLYASFDGWQICLRAPREDGDHMIYLEPPVVAALLMFVVDMKERDAALRKVAADIRKEFGFD